ncbi:MAG: hypothetical protein ABSD71_03925 [Bacteroidales bacterium]|jgi:hypothetical protein
MKPVLIAGISIVNLALISYTTAIIIQTRKKLLTRYVLIFLVTGVVFDVTSTICMIIASGKSITLHGIIGYSALAGMLTETIFSYSQKRKYGLNSAISTQFKVWSAMAYFYWVLAYITGAFIVMMK